MKDLVDPESNNTRKLCLYPRIGSSTQTKIVSSREIFFKEGVFEEDTFFEGVVEGDVGVFGGNVGVESIWVGEGVVLHNFLF